MIKTEGGPPKEIKQEPNTHQMHGKEPSAGMQSMGGYPNIYQRQPFNVPPSGPPQHMSRQDEELRRWVF